MNEGWIATMTRAEVPDGHESDYESRFHFNHFSFRQERNDLLTFGKIPESRDS